MLHVMMYIYTGGKTTTCDSAHDDDLPLYYNKCDYKMTNWAEYNQRGFGAGGLPPNMFSHVTSNWPVKISKHARVEKMETETDAAYGPGMSLGNVPGETRKRKASSEGSSSSKISKVEILSSSVKTHTGGRGLQRMRAQKILKGITAIKLIIINVNKFI